MCRWHKVLVWVLLWIGLSSVYASPISPVKRWQTPNGLRVWYVYRPQLPMVAMRLVVGAGSSQDQANGLAWMTAHMLSAGAKGLTQKQIAQDLAQSGARFNVQVGRQDTMLSLDSLVIPDHLQVATAVFASLLGSPTFPPEIFAERQRRHIALLKLRHEQPTQLAYDVLYQKLYPNSDYGLPIAGTVNSIKQLPLSQVKAFYNQYYVARNMTLILVGDVNVKEAHQIAQQISSVVPMGQLSVLPKFSAVAHDVSESEVINHTHHATQATIVIGTRAAPVSSADYLSELLAAEVLGGQNSKLYQILRSQNGLVYRVGAHINSGMLPGVFSVFSETNAGSANQVVATIQSAINDICRQGPSNVSIQIARHVILGHLLLRVSSNQGVATRLVWLAKNHLPVDYFAHFNQRLKQISVKQIKAALNRLMEKQYKVVVIVGGNH